MIAINDPAGMAIGFSNAVNKYTEHTCRLITKEIRYNFMFEKDLHLPWLDSNGFDEIESLLTTADIFHFHMTADECIDIGPFQPKDYIKGKEILHHHHGHPEFRSNPDRFREKYRRLGRKAIVSTPDLLKLMPEASWQPNLVPISDPLYRPIAVEQTDIIRVCQAPTRKDLKNTDDFARVTRRLQDRFPFMEPVVIDNTRHTECLRIKQACHIHFDHMQGYYGVSSLESLSQGKPVIAGLDEWNIKWIETFTGSSVLPWVVARNVEQLEAQLGVLLADDAFRNDVGKKSRIFMENYWSERDVVNVLLETYTSL